MTEAQKQFEEWFDEYSDKNDIRLAINYGAYEIAGDAWQHQQQRIDELQSNLNIAVDAMQNLVDVKGRHNTEIAYNRISDALKQIEVK